MPNSNGQKVGEKTFLIGTEANGLKIYDMEADELREPWLPNVSQDISHWKIYAFHDVCCSIAGNHLTCFIGMCMCCGKQCAD